MKIVIARCYGCNNSPVPCVHIKENGTRLCLSCLRAAVALLERERSVQKQCTYQAQRSSQMDFTIYGFNGVPFAAAFCREGAEQIVNALNIIEGPKA